MEKSEKKELNKLYNRLFEKFCYKNDKKCLNCKLRNHANLGFVCDLTYLSSIINKDFIESKQEFGKIQIKCLNCGNTIIEKFEPTMVYSAFKCLICKENNIETKRID